MKASELGSPVEWHQDWAFYPHTNDDLLAVGVAIDDMTRENGCLLAIPGSHKGRVYDHHQDGRFVGAVTEPDFDDSGAEAIEVEAGGISIHHVRTLHGSMPNTSSNTRRLFLLMYCSGDSFSLTETPGQITDWEDYERSFLRGGPSQEVRVDACPVRLPLPGPLRPGSIFENQTALKQSNINTA
jgi:ectoine hydroxylase-related dioxygenase (phytanoyl-CoA dioxygenase family)